MKDGVGGKTINVWGWRDCKRKKRWPLPDPKVSFTVRSKRDLGVTRKNTGMYNKFDDHCKSKQH